MQDLVPPFLNVDLHFKLGLGQFLEKRYTSIETFAA